MALPLAAAVTSFVIAFLIVPVIIKYSLEKNLVDIPGRRKIHKKVTPSMGGIAIFLGFFLAAVIWIDLPHLKEIRYVLIALFIMFFLGVRDDLVPLKPYMKLFGQVLAATILIVLLDVRIKSFYGLFGLYEIHLILSYVITTLTIIIITNSFNLIDGLDGLASTIAIVALTAFGFWFHFAGDDVYSVLSFSMAGAVAAFLVFNWDPSEIFMGDTGALVIGMMLSVAAIRFIDFNYNLPLNHTARFSASVSTAACFIIIPLVDTIRILILRVSRGQSPFTPDKSHIHHGLMRLGLTHAKTALLLGTIQVVFIGMAFALNGLNDNYMLLCVVGLATVLSVILDRIILNRLNKENSAD